MFTADPRKVKNARKLSVISYDEMLELASLGAQVLNNRSVEMAKKYNIQLEVLSSLTRAKGTIVKEAKQMEKMMISGVAKEEKVARISIIGVPDKPGPDLKPFLSWQQKMLSGYYFTILGQHGTKDISFTVDQQNLKDTIELLSAYVELIGASSVVYDENVAKVSVVGAGMGNTSWRCSGYVRGPV